MQDSSHDSAAAWATRGAWIACTAWLAWLVMMATHEAGHVLAAIATGGVVRHVTLYPFALSRTDVSPNPHPLIEVWAGPLAGSLVPLAFAAIGSLINPRGWRIAPFVAGFCLIANGAYIGVGAFGPIGDARQMRQHGAPTVVMLAFGAAAVTGGLFLWHRLSRRARSLSTPPLRGRDVVQVAVVAAVLTAIGLLVGPR